MRKRPPVTASPWVIALLILGLAGIAYTLQLATAPADGGLRPLTRSVQP